MSTKSKKKKGILFVEYRQALSQLFSGPDVHLKTYESAPIGRQKNMGKTLLSTKTCAGCKTNIGCSHFRNYMDTFWHLECFCCYVCDHPIHDFEFSMLANYPYHKSCHKELYHLKCDVCKQRFTSNCTKHRLFNQKLCDTHWSDGTPYCSSCQRMKPRDARYFTLGDGRILCCECHDTAIMDNKECQLLYMEIQDFFAGLDLKLGQQIPLLMVEREALNEAMELRNDELWHLPTIRGLCLVERAHHDDGDRKVDTMERQTRLTYKCDVIAILILYGLPRLMMGSLLAHEMMHAWLAVNGYYPLSPEVEEGICQVVAHMWLDSEITSASSSNNTTTTAPTSALSSSLLCSSSTSPSQYIIIRSRRTPFEKRLGYLFKGHIEFHASPVYGDGFRACHRAILEYGFRHALEHVKLTGKFPC